MAAAQSRSEPSDPSLSTDRHETDCYKAAKPLEKPRCAIPFHQQSLIHGTILVILVLVLVVLF